MSDIFPSAVAGLPGVQPSPVVDVPDGGVFYLRIAPVAKRIGEDTVRMLAYNGSIPGPDVAGARGIRDHGGGRQRGRSRGDRPLARPPPRQRFDGVPHETQDPIPVGGQFEYRVHFPDPGMYWYHPHIREDYGQDLGLYGNILVIPADPEYWPPAHREELLIRSTMF